MATLIIDEEIAQKLRLIAERERRPVDEVLRSMVESYELRPTAEADEALEAFIGMFDDDVTDLSTTVKETLREYFKNKKDHIDRYEHFASGSFQSRRQSRTGSENSTCSSQRGANCHCCCSE